MYLFEVHSWTRWKVFNCTLLYLLLQVRHKDEVTQIRAAGHDTLAIIVEEYKVCDCGLSFI